MILMQLNVYNGGLQSAYLVLAIIPIMNALVSLIFLVFEQRRMRADLILCYKMLFGHLNICSVDFFKLDQQA